MFQTCYIRKAFVTNRFKRTDNLTLQDWSLLAGESKLAARDDSTELYKQMQEQGWIVKNVLLSAEEQVRYIFDQHQSLAL